MPLDVHESLVAHGIIPGKEIGPEEPQALSAMPGDQVVDLLEKLLTFHGKTLSVERLFSKFDRANLLEPALSLDSHHNKKSAPAFCGALFLSYPIIQSAAKQADHDQLIVATFHRPASGDPT